MSRGCPHLILLGPPASGKGTQGRRLAADAGLAYLSTGALLRETVAAGGPLVAEIQPVLDRGGYVADATMCRIIEPWLARQTGGWILDGFPRTLFQDQFLGKWLEARGLAIDAAISLEVPKEELIRRIEGRVECATCRWSGQVEDLHEGSACPDCGAPATRRSDDSLENFLSRHEEFREHTVPVIERHAEAGDLWTCDATAPIEDVAAKLRAILEQLKIDGQATA